MGKSKKVKAERINAVRKQYDAFLEEDRKRKDRNEYIIDRLDKMRSCSAVLRNRITSKNNDIVNYYHLNNDRIGCMERNFPLLKKSENSFNGAHPRNTLTAMNEVLLKEISKNYILIPRHTNTLEYENKYTIDLNADDNSNWKSKYSILDELKRNEKEEQNDSLLSNSKQITSNRNHVQLDDIKTEQTNDNVQRKNSKPLLQQINNEVVEKISDNSNDDLEQSEFDSKIYTVSLNSKIEKKVDEICYNLNEYTNSPDEKTKNNIDVYPQIEGPGKAATNTIKSSSAVFTKEQSEFSGDHKNNFDECKEDIYNLTEKEKIQDEYEIKFKPQADVTPKLEECHENIKINNENKIEMESLKEYTQPKEIQSQEHGNDYETNPDFEKTCFDESLLKDNFKPLENNDFSTLTQQHLEEKEHSQGIGDRNDQVINTNLDINNQYQSQESSRSEINPSNQDPIHDQNITQEENVSIINEHQIREFETEQNNMFYTEQADINYTYDQTGVCDTVQAEYTNNADYVQNENYTYYQEAAQEQAYISGINEHEESNEQYDPHYEEQYGNYEQVNEQNTNIEHYETDENIDQQNYDQLQSEKLEYNDVQEVEQQLDIEEGYNEQINCPNISNVEPVQPITEEETIIT